MDFQTSDGKTIDIKTASESYHTRILVPHDQYRNQPKDYYVGVRILPGEATAEIIGFAAWGELTRSDAAITQLMQEILIHSILSTSCLT